MAQVVATNPAVSSLLETAVSYDGCQSLNSDSERSQTVGKRRTCICLVGDACQIMSTAYSSNKDPRGCFVLIPSYEVQLREAYCRYLRPNATREEIDQIDEFCVAVHHFHPTIIDRCFNTDPDQRQEEDILPMPARTTTATGGGSKALQYLFDDHDRVVCHQTGAPTGEYWVVPSYSFDSAHGDLKQSMGHMPQLELERCVRRMKREARRQKWEAIVDKWEAVSKRSLRSESTRATDALTVPPSPSSQSSTASSTRMIQAPPSLILQTQQAPPVLEVQGGKGLQMHHLDNLENQFVDELDVVHGKLRGLGVMERKVEEEEESLRRCSMMTAQEVLESELDTDDDTITDLHTVDEPPEDVSLVIDEQEAQTTTKTVSAVPPHTAEAVLPPPAAAPPVPRQQQQQDDGSLSSLSNEGSSHAEERGPTAKRASSIVKPKVFVANHHHKTSEEEKVSSNEAQPAVQPNKPAVDPRHVEMRKALDTLISTAKQQQQLAEAKTQALKASRMKISEKISEERAPSFMSPPPPAVAKPRRSANNDVPETVTTTSILWTPPCMKEKSTSTSAAAPKEQQQQPVPAVASKNKDQPLLWTPPCMEEKSTSTSAAAPKEQQQQQPVPAVAKKNQDQSLLWTPPCMKEKSASTSVAPKQQQQPGSAVTTKNQDQSLLWTPPCMKEKSASTSAAVHKREQQGGSAVTTENQDQSLLWTPPCMEKVVVLKKKKDFKPEAPKPAVEEPSSSDAAGVTTTTSTSTITTPKQVIKTEDQTGGSSPATPATGVVSETEVMITKPCSSNKRRPSFLKSRSGAAVAIGVYCAFVYTVVTCANHCVGVLKSREEAFA